MIRKFEFCKLADGRPVTAFEISNSFGEKAVILDYGAIIASLQVRDRTGKIGDVVLGADPGQDISKTPYTAALMGRCGNRIAYGTFSIDGKTYHLKAEEGPHHLHGAEGNWANQFFTGTACGEDKVELRLKDDGRDGWGCSADVLITYTFDDSHALTLQYEAKPEGDTVISPTCHAYFNLNAPADVLDTEMHISADSYAPKSDLHMPDGRLAPVAGTPLDFTAPRTLRETLKDQEHFFPDYQDSYDDFYSVNGRGFRQMAEAYNPESGRVLQVSSDAPSLIFYTPVVKEPVTNKGGLSYKGHIAFCLETQYMPNAVNCPEYPSPVFHKGETMHMKTVFAFGVR